MKKCGSDTVKQWYGKVIEQYNQWRNEWNKDDNTIRDGWEPAHAASASATTDVQWTHDRPALEIVEALTQQKKKRQKTVQPVNLE